MMLPELKYVGYWKDGVVGVCLAAWKCAGFSIGYLRSACSILIQF